MEQDENILRHPSISSTLPLTKPPVPANPPRGIQLASTGARVHCDWFADDEAIADKLADRLARVCVADLVDLVGVEPDLALAAPDDGGGEALLRGEIDPVEERVCQFLWS